MKTEDLTAKGLTEEQVTFVMAEHGKDIKREQDKTKAAEDARGALQGQLTTATDALKAFEGIDPANIKVELEKAQTALKDVEEKHAAELAKRDSRTETEKLLSGHAFINDITRDFYVGEIEKALDDKDNKGKSRQDIFDALTKGEDGTPKAGIFAEGTQPKFAGAAPANPLAIKPDAKTDGYAQRLAEARKNKDNVAAITVKNEAAAEGVILI